MLLFTFSIDKIDFFAESELACVNILLIQLMEISLQNVTQSYNRYLIDIKIVIENVMTFLVDTYISTFGFI
jgi:hypothetical protein